MTHPTSDWFMLTPSGVLRAFSSAQPDPTARSMQVLLTGDCALEQVNWMRIAGLDAPQIAEMQAQGWVQALSRPLQGPDAKLDDFLQHVIASLSAERRAVLASQEGFCLGRSGLTQDEADVLSAAAADFSEFAARQSRRGWRGASGYVAFHSDPEFLLPDHAFVPFWVDGTGYWLILLGEPLLNSPALVELLWGIKQAGTRFSSGG
ncbi:MAG: hypothetical protein FD135_2192 [Comamonadaceae bacterium]|nr:MAG: hypothetical protein FD135_2192 [Comamonadaceae bacterium]